MGTNIGFQDIGTVDESKLKFVVMGARYRDKWVFVKHKERETFEFPGGHIEKGEEVLEAAKRELKEESGAETFSIEPTCEYYVERDGERSYGRIHMAYIDVLGELPNMEIESVHMFEQLPEKLTYPDIVPTLFKKMESNLK